MSQPLDSLPIWALFILTILFMLLAVEVGYRIGKVFLKDKSDQSDAGVGVMVGAALALLGLLLAFVINIAIGIFNDRRQLVVLEANAIDTTYLRAGYLAEPYGVESRQLLREYVNLRLEVFDPGKTDAAIARSIQIQDELWVRAEEVARENPGPTVALYLSSLNEIIDLHTERINAELGFRVPPIVVLGMYGVALLTMILVGVHHSYRENRNTIAVIIVVLILSLAFLLVIGLDRSNTGLIQIPQKALIDLQQKYFLLP